MDSPNPTPKRPPLLRPKSELPMSPNKPDENVYEPESLKKARQTPGLTDAQAMARDIRQQRRY